MTKSKDDLAKSRIQVVAPNGPPVQTQPLRKTPYPSKLLISASCCLCCSFWFLITCVFAGVFGWAYSNWKDSDANKAGGGIDLSGYGMCNGSQITVDKVWAWTQYPDPLRVTHIPSNVANIVSAFDGHNSIVWFRNATAPIPFKVVGGSGDVILTDVSFPTKECHFTIDPVVDYSIFAEATLITKAVLTAINTCQSMVDCPYLCISSAVKRYSSCEEFAQGCVFTCKDWNNDFHCLADYGDAVVRCNEQLCDQAPYLDSSFEDLLQC